MGEMVRLAHTVRGIECATPLEAQVRELRLIARHKPRYNRRSRHPEKVTWLKLTREPWPRLALVRRVLDDDADYLGPFSSRRTAEKCLAALHDTFPIRQCGGRLPRTPNRTPCALAEMSRCLSPCDGSVSVDAYAAVVADLRDNLLHRADEVVDKITTRMSALAELERFEEAGTHRDRLATFVRAASRTQRLSALTRCAEVVAARREEEGRWAVHVIRHGRLAAAGVIPVSAHAGDYVEGLRTSAETVAPTYGPTPAATAEETEKILSWLELPAIRLVRVEGEWACPVKGATRHLSFYDRAQDSRAGLVPFEERRLLPTVHQPAR
jgi:DNA polymerase-3 subunit epsilon